MIPIIIPRTLKGVMNILTVGIVVCVLCFLTTMAFWVRDQQTLAKYGQPDFNTLSIDQLADGMIVSGTIDLSLGTFAETYETNNGVRTSEKSKSLYYVIPIYETDSDGYYVIQYCIGFKADPDEFTVMDQICEQTWLETDDPIKLTVENGYIHVMDSDNWRYLMEWADDPSFYDNGSFIDWCAEYYIFGTDDREFITSRIVPYSIDKTKTAGVDLNTAWLFLGIGIILLLLLLILRQKKKRNDAKPCQPRQSLY